MSRKHHPRRLNIEALEGRTLMSSGMSTDPSKQARLALAVQGRAVKAVTIPVQVGTSNPAGSKAAAAEQKRLIQQQLRAQGQIKSAVSLDTNTIQIRLKQQLKVPVANVDLYQIPGLNITSATRNKSGTVVTLKTSNQAATKYQLTMIAPPKPAKPARAGLVSASAVLKPSPTILGTIPLTGTAPPISSVSSDLPRVVSATSTSNTTVVVQFNEPMSDRSLVAQYYEITPTNINTESGRVIVKNARFQEFGTGVSKIIDRSTVILTTESQNEMDYTVRVGNMVDLAGNPMAPPVIVGGLRFDPTAAQFQGTPPQSEVKNGVPTLIDTDGDGLSDNEEQRGWSVTFRDAAGSFITRTVTSDIRLADTDGDGFTDAQENQLKIDPRDQDTDDDLLTDWQEYYEVFCNHLDADTDKDGVDDGTEFLGVKSSPNFADTDGDQIPDGIEIALGGPRNVRVADLPRLEIEVGGIDLRLDVRFSETNNEERRDLETRNISSTMTASSNQTFTRSDTVGVEAHLNFTGGLQEGNKSAFAEGGASVGYTFQQSSETQTANEQAYERSLSTDREVTRGFTVERRVEGARMSATIDLRNVGTLSYRVKNLQVTAFIQDPQDPSRLSPVATLLPEAEPNEGYTLGPLTTSKGPLIFSNSTIVPSLVESLLANSSGLVFRISNYDIIDENDRNFAFVSQEIVDRTARLVIDYGGASYLRASLGDAAIDELRPGDETEIYRVAVASGRPFYDTTGDGVVDENDRRVTFDLPGKQVGITLFDSLDAVGLARFEARFDGNNYQEYEPGGSDPVNLTEDQRLNSYSTFIDPSGRERFYRVRGISNDNIIEKYWEIVTPQGIDQTADLKNLILKTNAPVSINFVQDLDKDGLSADVEYFLRTSDSPLPFGAVIPGTTDVANDTVAFSTDPGIPEGSIVRVTHDTARDVNTGVPSLLAGQNYIARKTQEGTYRFFESATAVNPVNLPGTVTAGIYAASRPFDTDADGDTITFAIKPIETDLATMRVKFNVDPGLESGDPVKVTQSKGGLTAGTTYYVRKHGSQSYSFFDSAENAQDGGLGGRVTLTGMIIDGLVRGTDRSFATGTVVQVTWGGGGLVRGTNYYIRNEDNGSYSFFLTAKDATAGSSSNAGRVDLTSEITAGLFSPTAKGRDTDGDGLDDRFEALIGWRVNTPQSSYQVYSSPNRADSNFDAPKPGVDSNGNGLEDRLEYSGSDLLAAPAGWADSLTLDTDGDGTADSADGLRNRFEVFQLAPQNNGDFDHVLNPSRKDTDGDGVDDGTEIIGYKITPITGDKPYFVKTDPISPMTDSDTFSDGLERILGLDPTNGNDTDEDGDGLPDVVEALGWTVYTFGVSTQGYKQGEYALGFDRTAVPMFTDVAANVIRFTEANDPNVTRFSLVRITGGLPSSEGEFYFLGRLVNQPDPNGVQYGLYLSTIDAAAGTSRGALDLTSQVTEIKLAREYVRQTPLAWSAEEERIRLSQETAEKLSQVTLVQVTGGGLTANTSYYMGRIADQDQNSDLGVWYSFYLSPTDAARGTISGALNLTSLPTSVRLPAESRKFAANDAVDTDGDGLSDYDEFFIGTDPSSVDSDRDGIEDRLELLGFALGHQVGGKDLGYIKTNPLDADTDDDLRSDGDEAELVDIELKRWVVRVTGQKPYQVWSNPLVADADFDGLVDGEEYADLTTRNSDGSSSPIPDGQIDVDRYRSDPNNGNTDGDHRDDGTEWVGRTNPLVADIQVTVIASRIEGPSTTPYEVRLDVRKPDKVSQVGSNTGQAGVGGLAADSTLVYGAQNSQVSQLEVHIFLGGHTIAAFNYYDEKAGVWVLTKVVGGYGPDGRAYPFGLYDWKMWYRPGDAGVPIGAKFRLVMSNGFGEFQTRDDLYYNPNIITRGFYDVGDGGFNSVFFIPPPPTVDVLSIPLRSRSQSFGLADRERFSIEGTINIGGKVVRLGGLEGVKAKQTYIPQNSDGTPGAVSSAREVRPVFSYMEVADKFIEEYYFEVKDLSNQVVRIYFYFLIG